MPRKTTLALILIIAILALNNLRLWKIPPASADDNEESVVYDQLNQLKREKSALVREFRFFNYLYRSVDIAQAPRAIRFDEAEIIELARAFETPENMYYFVRDNITYLPFQPVHKGAVEVLRAGKGDCVDQADLLASLLRAGGYPSKDVFVVLGTVGEKRYVEGLPPENHAWVEFRYGGKRLVLDPTKYLGKFEFGRWTKDDFYNTFLIDDYFIYNDKTSSIVKKFDNSFLE